jgi:iron-sulfur cluster repair protein YtfE (RIC family)
MPTIREFMTEHHKQCDELFVDAESAVDNDQWDVVQSKWPLCHNEIETHFQREEEVLFPEFESVTGMTGGPTQMMRIEHQQIRELFKEMDKAVKAKDKVNYLGLSETLMVTMQQHNMKEEQMLYPMIDGEIASKDELITTLASYHAEGLL